MSFFVGISSIGGTEIFQVVLCTPLRTMISSTPCFKISVKLQYSETILEFKRSFRDFQGILDRDTSSPDSPKLMRI